MKIVGVSDGSIGRMSGLKFDDTILMCARVRRDTTLIHAMQGNDTEEILHFFNRALMYQEDIILFVRR